MTDTAPVETSLAIDRVERARGDGDNVRLRVSGRWLGSDQSDGLDALLVVQLQGRRHRFPADREHGEAEGLPGAWVTSFTIPAWAEPSQHGQAALWVGSAVVAVPPPGGGAASPPPSVAPLRATPAPPDPLAPQPATPVPPDPVAEQPATPAPPDPVAEQPATPEPPAPVAPRAVASEPSPSVRSEPGTEAGRGGPLADLLFKETVSALHGELEQRAAESARLRGALADAKSELDAREATQSGLETAHAELRGELEKLIAAVARQRTEFDDRLAQVEAQRALTQHQLDEMVADREVRAAESAALREQLAAVSVSRDAAASESAGLRTELERLGTELTVTREQTAAGGGDLGEAQRLLADARALTEQLRSG